jgi:hypothetical protein
MATLNWRRKRATALDTKLLANPPYERSSLRSSYRRSIVDYRAEAPGGCTVVDTDLAISIT